MKSLAQIAKEKAREILDLYISNYRSRLEEIMESAVESFLGNEMDCHDLIMQALEEKLDYYEMIDAVCEAADEAVEDMMEGMKSDGRC